LLLPAIIGVLSKYHGLVYANMCALNSAGGIYHIH